MDLHQQTLLRKENVQLHQKQQHSTLRLLDYSNSNCYTHIYGVTDDPSKMRSLSRRSAKNLLFGKKARPLGTNTSFAPSVS